MEPLAESKRIELTAKMKKIIANNDIVVCSEDLNPYSEAAIKHLKNARLNFTEINFDKFPLEEKHQYE